MVLMLVVLLFSAAQLVTCEVEIIPAILIHEEHHYVVPNNQRVHSNFPFVSAAGVNRGDNQQSNIRLPIRLQDNTRNNFRLVDLPSRLQPPPVNTRLQGGQLNSLSYINRPTTPRSKFRPIDSRVPQGLKPPLPHVPLDLRPPLQSNIRNQNGLMNSRLHGLRPSSTFPERLQPPIASNKPQNTYGYNHVYVYGQPNIYPNQINEQFRPVQTAQSNNNQQNLYRDTTQRSSIRTNVPKNHKPSIKNNTLEEPLGVTALNNAIVTVRYLQSLTSNSNGISTYRNFPSKLVSTTTKLPRNEKIRERLRNSPIRDNNRDKITTDYVKETTALPRRRDKFVPQTRVTRMKFRQNNDEYTPEPIDQNRNTQRRKLHPSRVISSQSYQAQRNQGEILITT